MNKKQFGIVRESLFPDDKGISYLSLFGYLAIGMLCEVFLIIKISKYKKPPLK